MHSRRQFLLTSGGALISIATPVLTQVRGQATRAVAVSEVFGDGVRLTKVAIEYDQSIDGADLSISEFRVEGRTIADVFVSTSPDPADRAGTGRFVIVSLSPADGSAVLAEQNAPGPKGAAGPNAGGPGKAGSRPAGGGTTYRPAVATIVPPRGKPLTTSSVRNLVVDDFHQLEFRDRNTSDTLKYNLFVPKNYDPARSYPLVLFMHDAGATGEITRTTLFQGRGAISWASPEDQAKRPAFVLAPQYAEIIADDDSQTSSMLDTTIDLIDTLAEQYRIDRARVYATGQSGGCMMAIAMNVKYPELFAASFLVAGQWAPALVKPLAGKKLWILVSQDDNKAFPGQNAIVDVLEKEGAKISRAVWDGTWNAADYRAAFERIDREGSPINYVSFGPGSVIPAGQSAAGASGHRNTWRIAYSIEPIREWIFRQHA